MSHDGQGTAPDAQSPLTPAQRYVVHIARTTVELYEAHGAEEVARWNAPRGTADLPGGLVFAYDIAMRQIGQLLVIISALTGDAS